MAGAAAIPRPLKRSRRCKHASFPLDLLPEVAARSDPATLVRCAATSKEIRRHIADPAFHGRLRLRHADRFVPSLLRGGLADTCDMSLRLVDRTTGDVTRLLSTAACSPPDADGWPVSNCQTVAARDGLILFGRVGSGLEDKLCVCCPATGRRQVLPPGPRFRGQYALLVGDRGGDGVVGRPFQVLKACFVKPQGGWRSLHIHTFSSEQGAWSPRIVRSSSPLIMHGDEMLQGPGIVAGDTVHWLYHMNRTHYVLKLHLKAPRVTFTELPKSFHRACSSLRDRWWGGHILLATSSSGRSQSHSWPTMA
ncbi:hypothetical protein BAE44_0012630 [Dichanthelium oligosanthes]|uniref:DUF7595 domain-containing protein n=1 Tax=Dichanthelium oligosanthes TaxID=888268 RepID=A0A1E5VMQ0_9POAL|nr:hypothetical protein BAE44_0012630 [Dichanthelium oligosanthes]